MVDEYSGRIETAPGQVGQHGLGALGVIGLWDEGCVPTVSHTNVVESARMR